MTQLSTLTNDGGPAKPDRPSSLKSSSPRYGEKMTYVLFRVAAWLTVLITVGILLAFAIPSIEFFRQVPVFDFLFGDRWARSRPAVGDPVSP